MGINHSIPRRRRTHPLIPEPFQKLSISRLEQGEAPLAQGRCKFCPELNFSHYRNQLSEEKQKDMDQRARKLFRRAVQNQKFEASEYNWEADAWNDVFGLIRDDDTFRMLDKRTYEFVEKDKNDNISVKRRIPDATMGLRTYSKPDLDHDYNCSVVDCEINHDSKEPEESLLDYRIRAQMRDKQRGLIVDGIWGEQKLIFPFAVYEAKKLASTWRQAEEQVYHAFKVYLAMLDDLARDPLDVTVYQDEESPHYQLFGFTSCGPHWKVYVAWNFEGDCHAETIWEGDIKDLSRAYELICLVDQVHDFAANQHRDFVTSHLIPWLGINEDLDYALYGEDQKALELVDLKLVDVKQLKLLPDRILIEDEPAWLKVKKASDQSRDIRAAEKRSRNRLKVKEDARNCHSKALQNGRITKVSSTAQIQLQRARGRQSNKPNDPQSKQLCGQPKNCAKKPTTP